MANKPFAIQDGIKFTFSNESLTSTSSIAVQTGDADRWLVRLRREGSDVDPSGSDGVTVYSTNYDSEGNAIGLHSFG